MQKGVSILSYFSKLFARCIRNVCIAQQINEIGFSLLITKLEVINIKLSSGENYFLRNNIHAMPGTPYEQSIENDAPYLHQGKQILL